MYQEWNMRKKLAIDIECGETTCASKPGTFCRFRGSKKFGQLPCCMLFPDPTTMAAYTELEEIDGWIQRCANCLEMG